MQQARILVADDDPVICDVLREIITGLGHEAACTHTAAETTASVEQNDFDVVLLDLRFPDCADFSTLSTIRKKSPKTDVIIVTAEADDLAIVSEAVRLGAFDYVPKPIREDDIRIRLTRLLEMRRLTRSHAYAIAQLSKGSQFDDIIGDSPAIKSVVEQARDFATYDFPVLITGETGTGKELVAKALHYGSSRKEKPYISINCAALPTELTESELFGHEKGAFTGADAARRGAFEEAEDGTLFLDEIGDMSASAQAALLRVLESGEYHSVGGKLKKSAARVIFATNQDLNTLLNEGRFRKDLYYRVDRMRIHIPPLRERKQDIKLLAQHFVARVEEKVGKGVHGISADTMEMLERYAWPGNVRELKNEIERAYIHTKDDIIKPMDLSTEVVMGTHPEADGAIADPATLDDLYKLVEALKASAGNVTKAAKALGVHRNTVHRWIRKYSLEALLPK